MLNAHLQNLQKCNGTVLLRPHSRPKRPSAWRVSDRMESVLSPWTHGIDIEEMMSWNVEEICLWSCLSVWVLDIGERWHRAHSHAPLRSFVQVGRHAYLTPGTPPQSKMSRCELVEWKPKKTNFYTKRHGANFSNKNSEMILLEKMYGWLCFSEHSVFKFAAAVPCMVSQALNFALGTNFERKI